METTPKMSIADWVRRAFVAYALILLLIGMALFAACQAITDLARQDYMEALKTRSLEYLLDSTRQQAAFIGEKLQWISADTSQFAKHLSLALRYPARRRLQAHKAIRRSPEGALYTEKDTGGFAIFYSGIQPIGMAEIQKLQRLLRLDPVMPGIFDRHPEAAQIYFNSHDSLNIVYPYLDALSQYRPKVNIPDYPFYYLADAQHNPGRGPVWTGPYHNPGGKAWLVSCIVPVYRGDFLEGVAGMAITVDSILQQLQPFQVPWKGYRVLLGRDGTLMDLPPENQADWGLAGLTSHRQGQTVRQDRFTPGRFNILEYAGDGSWGKAVLEHASGSQLITSHGSQLIAWSTIPHTPWKLLALAPRSEAFGAADQVRTDIENLSGLMMIGLGLFYLVFLFFLVKRARHTANDLSRPLRELSGITLEITEGKFKHKSPSTPLKEIQGTGNQLIRLGQRLQTEIATRKQAEQRLRDSLEEMKHLIVEHTHELDSEIRKRQRLEKALDIQGRYDALSGLPNHTLFYDRARQALALARRNKSLVVVVFINLDNFEPLDEPAAQQADHELLRAVANRLLSCVRASDTVYRISRNEFVALLLNFSPRERPENIAGALLERLDSPIDSDSVEQRVTLAGNLGIAIFPEDGDSVYELLHQADMEMYRAKEAGKNTFCFTVERP